MRALYRINNLFTIAFFVCSFAFSTSAATFTVTKTADTNDGVCDTDCSLREAIAAANVASSDDIVAFDPAVFNVSQTITLNGTQLTVANNGSLSINGTGANLLAISGNASSRVLEIASNATTTLNALTVTNGKVVPNDWGAGILNGGNLTVNDSVISNNSAGNSNGGGIFNNGPGRTLTVNRSTISGNVGNGGGVYNFNGSASIDDSHIDNNSGINGTGIINGSGPLTLTNSTVSGNSAGNGGGIGGGILNSGGTVTATNVQIVGNSAANIAGGGGIYSEAGSLNISNSEIRANTAAGDGGGIRAKNSTVTVTNTRILNNNVTSGRCGGGIANWGDFSGLGTVTLTNVIFTGNSAACGGAIYNDFVGTTNVQRSIISQNIGTNGGGGIMAGSGTVNVFSSSVVNNSTAVSSAGGGGIQLGDAVVNLRNTTVANNTANLDGGGIRNGSGLPARGTINVQNSIVADNSTASGTSKDVFGNITSQGYNLIENPDGATIIGNTTGNIIGRDPQLLPLRDNGGPTQTMALMATSPAIDAGDPDDFLATDQRGLPRPQDGDLQNGPPRPDIGAYERSPNLFVVTKMVDTNDGICDSDCSLREAIDVANVSPLADRTIVFDDEAVAANQEISLTMGSLMVGGQIGIYGPKSTRITLNGNSANRIFWLSFQTAALGFRQLNLTSGRSNETTGPIGGGGAIYAGAFTQLGVVDSALSDSISESPIINAQPGGGAVFGGSAKMYFERVEFHDNLTASSNQNDSIGGGAIYCSGGSGGYLELFDSIVRRNTVRVESGGATASGGGVRVRCAAIIRTSVIRSNATISPSATRSLGGGIANTSQMIIDGTTVFENEIDGDGGGIFNGSGGILTIRNSTISRNVARMKGGAGGRGGGISNIGSPSGASLLIQNSSVAFNRAEIGGGVWNQTNSTVTAANTIFGRNDAVESPDFGGAFTSDGYNLIENPNGTVISGVPTGNIQGENPLLDPILRLNGAQVPTHALRLGSVVLDKGKAISGIVTDQRGRLRPFDFETIPNASGGDGSDIGAFERQAEDITHGVPFDYDGDGRSDISVWRPSDGTWNIIQSGTSSVRAQGWGLNGDKLAPADFDGDGKTDLAVFRESDSNWYIFNSATNTATVAGWGLAGDLPVPADYGGDGKADLAVFRPSEGKWYRRDSDGKLHFYEWGLSGDKPAPADFNGDGIADMTVFRPSEGKWYILNSGNASISEFTWGLNGDVPVPGDYSGDGKSDFAVFRPSNQTWYRIHSDTFQIHIITWGLPGDFPTPGDYDGDGRQDLAVFRPSNSTWFINSSTGGIYSQPFGLTGDVPVENAFVY